ncbi:hypothetical protein ASY01nite_16180 [Acetobacter syzygii]|nr:hypothetical protein Absy_021_050 [Acetobacter syzygii]GBR62444.1 hypothetical protein AA0483_0376 [Acetobacter syzygii NRIC 0483]GEL56552.1 hypothetical protein ASY01nite_16180 [Acetobacter syzygii]
MYGGAEQGAYKIQTDRERHNPFYVKGESTHGQVMFMGMAIQPGQPVWLFVPAWPYSSGGCAGAVWVFLGWCRILPFIRGKAADGPAPGGGQ